MARAARMLSDEAIAHEVDEYNPRDPLDRHARSATQSAGVDFALSRATYLREPATGSATDVLGGDTRAPDSTRRRSDTNATPAFFHP